MKGDEGLTEVAALISKRLQASQDIDGDRPIDMGLLLDAADLAASMPSELGHRREAVLAYIQALHEPRRTIFCERRAGHNPAKIAQKVGLDSKAVCWHLSQIYADLRGITEQRAAAPLPLEPRP